MAISELKDLISSKDNTTIIYPNIVEGNIPPSSVGEEKIKNNSISHNKLKDNSVSTNNIAALSITLSKMQPNSVGTTQIIDGSINGDKIISNSIDGRHINNYPLINHNNEFLNLDELKGNLYLITNIPALTIQCSTFHMLTFDYVDDLKVIKTPYGTNGFRVQITNMTPSSRYYLYVSNDGYNVIFNHQTMTKN